jgi:hypothetical protein
MDGLCLSGRPLCSRPICPRKMIWAISSSPGAVRNICNEPCFGPVEDTSTGTLHSADQRLFLRQHTTQAWAPFAVETGGQSVVGLGPYFGIIQFQPFNTIVHIFHVSQKSCLEYNGFYPVASRYTVVRFWWACNR